jgi:hypothetical protein
MVLTRVLYYQTTSYCAESFLVSDDFDFVCGVKVQ